MKEEGVYSVCANEGIDQVTQERTQELNTDALQRLLQLHRAAERKGKFDL